MLSAARNGNPVAVNRVAPADELAAHFAAALEAGNAQGARHLAEQALRDGVEPAVIHAELIQPAMRRVGELWEEGLISVADEHLASAIVERVLAVIYPRCYVAPPRSRETVLLACVEDERHVLGLRTASDIIEGAGFDVVFLGADVPVAALAAATRRHLPKVVGLSATLPWEVEAMQRTIAEVRRAHPPVRLVLGGAGVPDGPLDDGLLAVDDVRDAVAAVNSLLG